MALQHDHFFILTEPGAPAADLLRLDVPVNKPSTTLQLAADCNPLRLRSNYPHHLELVFNSARKGQRLDLRPDLPLSIRW